MNKLRKANPQLSFWEGIEKFRAEADLDILDSEILLDGVRDRSIGYRVDVHAFLMKQLDIEE